MISILYVDDEPALLDIGKLYLERKGEFRVETATSAREALLMLERGKYDAIISDYQMPGMNGIDFLKEVRECGNTIPFIVFTGRGREEVVIQALNEGADFYLQKGGDPRSQFAELTHKVLQAVHQRRAETSIRDHERREAEILNFLPDATFAIDTEGVVIAWNRAIERMTGVRAENIVGRGNYEYSLPFYHERRPILIDLVLNDDPTAAAKYPFIQHEGKKLFSEITIPHFNAGQGAALWFTASPLYNTRGEVIGAIESIREITERLKVQAALEESEQRYRNIVEDQTEFISRFLPDGTHVFVNDAYCRYFGFTREEILGHVFKPVIPDEDRKRVKTFFGSLTPDHPVDTIRHRIIMPDGRIRWQHWSDRAIYGADGRVREYQSVGRDITDVKEAERALHEKESWFRSLSEVSPDVMFMIDQDDRVVYVNRTAAAMIGRSADEMTGCNRSVLFPPDVAHKQRIAIERVFETNTGVRSVGQMCVHGTLRWFDHSLIPVRDDSGTARFIFGISRDITEQEETAEALRVRTEELDTKNRFLNTMLDTVPIGIFMVEAPSGKPIVVNREATRLIGRGVLPDATEENLAEAYEAHSAGTGTRYPAGMMPIVRGMKGETSHVDDMVVVRPDGSRVRLEIFGTPIKDRGGMTVASLACFMDITERKIAEEMIASLAQFPEENPHPVLRFSLDGTLLYANGPGKAWLASRGTQGIIAGIIERTLENGGRYSGETVDDWARTFQINATRPDDEQYVNIYVSDITERKRAEQTTRETSAKLNLLTSITRHDVLNQVSILRGYTQIALMRDTDPVIADILRKIDASGAAIFRHIEFTRDYQEIGLREPGWYNVRSLVDQHEPEGVTVSCTCDTEVYADPMFEKVISNIIDNAIRHGGHVTGIAFSCMEVPPGLLIAIADDGVGVPPDKKEEIFRKGYGSNTGFGLFLSREILAITGISLRETGIPGKGARFELLVPHGKYRTSP